MNVKIPGCHAERRDASQMIAIDRDTEGQSSMTKVSARGWDHLFFGSPLSQRS